MTPPNAPTCPSCGLTRCDPEAATSCCWVHYAAEPITPRTYIICFECGHVWTRRSLRRRYREQVRRIARNPIPTPFGPPDPWWEPIVSVVRSWFRRAKNIGFCQECIHDF